MALRRKLVSAAMLLSVFLICDHSGFAQEVDDEDLQGQLPRIDFETTRQDLGDMHRGQKKHSSFEFTNKGTGTLHIRSIHASCGCVETKVEPRDQFAAGEKGKISFDFDSTFFAGDIVRTLTVDTNAPSPSTVTLTFTADIKQEIFAKPAMLSIGEVSKGFTKEFSVEIAGDTRAAGTDETLPANFERAPLEKEERQKLSSNGPLSIVKVTSSSSQIVASINNETKPPKVLVKILGKLPIGPFRERISVWNSSRHLKELVIPVVGEVTGHVKPSAKYIEFGVVTKPSVTRRSLTLKSDSKDFKVNSIDVELRRTEVFKRIKDTDLIKTQYEKSKDGAVVHFDMQFPDAVDKATKIVNASGVFVVKTNDEDYKEIRVPFFGIVRRD